MKNFFKKLWPFGKDDSGLSEREIKAHKIICYVFMLNMSISCFPNHTDNTPLTDNECKKLAKITPMSFDEIRSSFPRPKEKN